MALATPDLNIPPSSSTLDVSIIDTTSSIKGVDTWKFLTPTIAGHDYLSTCAFSFLIEHKASGRKLVFDLGIRKDWWNYSPLLQARFEKGGYEIKVEKSVREILEKEGVAVNGIEAVIWSHWHFDHTRNPAEFDPSTALIVGPGFKENKLPGYPADPDSSILESDYAGRELREISFNESGLKIGRLDAFDYFGDGSYYILDSPGHAIGHICALARVSSNPDNFILMGGDAYHHAGELRPSAFMPLPHEIHPHPFEPLPAKPCLGEMFDVLLPHNDRTKPFYTPSPQKKVPMHFDPEEAVRTVQKLQEADVQDNIFMVAAHDDTLLDIIDFFPKKANNFRSKGWIQAARWKFLQDFAQAVGWKETVPGKREWAPAKSTS